MAWKKYFKDANMSPISGEKVPNFAKRNYSSYLPDVYTGHPNRIQRYFQYDQMDSDSEINAALDILAEFSTQQNAENETPFDHTGSISVSCLGVLCTHPASKNCNFFLRSWALFLRKWEINLRL